MDHPGIDAEPRILGQLLAAQSTFSMFSARQRMGEFVHRAVEGMPGLASCAMCTPGAERPRLGGEPVPECADCDVPEGDIDHDPNHPCRLSSCVGIQILPIRTQDRHFGFLLLKVEDRERYAPYEPFVGNLANSLAVNIERQWQRDRLEEANVELQRHRAHLEELVQKRMTELQISLERERELSAMLRAIRNVNQLITKEDDRDKLLKGACDNMVKTRGYHSAWIALFDDAGKLLFTAESGLGKVFLKLVKQLQRGELPVCGRQVLRQPSLFIKDSSFECTDCPLATIRSENVVMAARLEYSTKIYGLLVASIPNDLTPDTEEQSLFQELVDDIAFGLYKIAMEERRKQAEHALQERYKELNLLYNISSLAELPDISLDELSKRSVILLPPAWQSPKITEARIVLEGKTFQTAHFRETPWIQASDVIVAGKTYGRVEVCYLEEREASDEGPFLKEERLLIDAIALRLGQFISRTRAEETLRESETKHRTLVENLPQKVFFKDRNSVYISCNENYARDLKIKSEEITGKTDYDFYPKGLAKKYRQDDKRIIETGGIEQIEEKYIEDGRESWVQTVKAPVRDEKGNVIGLIGIFWDITERKQAEEDRKQSYQKLQQAMQNAIQAIALTAETRDPYTSGHQQRVTKLVCAIGEEIGLSKDKIEELHVAGILHDIGKMNVPAEILSKPGRLSEIEMSLIKTHPQVGRDILKKLELPWAICPIVLQHHERMDGSGYPSGLSGEDIMIEARILAVADVVEAMASHRPYRPALGIDKALEEVSQNKGVLYDPNVVDACVRLFTDKGFKFE